jgi:hypothetical protein
MFPEQPRSPGRKSYDVKILTNWRVELPADSQRGFLRAKLQASASR